jgi:hypothetical protein
VDAWTPEPGDISVCLHCQSALIFGVDLKLRVAERADLDKCPPDVLATIRKAQRMIPHAMAHNKAQRN